jgi:hypothetical protein
MTTTYHQALEYWQTELDNVNTLIEQTTNNPRAVAELVLQSVDIRKTMALEHAFYSPSYNKTIAQQQ